MALRKWINTSHIIRMAVDANDTTANLVLKMTDVENNVLITNTRPTNPDAAYFLYTDVDQVHSLIEQILLAKEGGELIDITAIKPKNKPKPATESTSPPTPKVVDLPKPTPEPEKEQNNSRQRPSMAHLAVQKTEDIEK